MKLISKTKRTALPLIGAVAVVLGSAQAAITVTNTGSNILRDTGPTSGTVTQTISGWSLNGGNTVVLYFTGENSEGVTAKYGTQDMIVVEAPATANRWVASIAYIINPTVATADIDLSWTSTGDTENMFTALSLGNVGSVGGSKSTDSGNMSFGYTTTLDGGFVVGAAMNNNFSGPVPTVSGNPDTFVFSGTISGNGAAIQAYGDIATAGSYTDVYGGSNAVASVVFQAAVPEPTVALLGGLGALLLLRRRRCS